MQNMTKECCPLKPNNYLKFLNKKLQDIIPQRNKQQANSIEIITRTISQATDQLILVPQLDRRGMALQHVNVLQKKYL